MRSIAIAVTILSALIALSAASEQPAMTVGDLAQLCAGSDHVSINSCRLYILGVTQGITVGMKLADGRTPGGRPCVPTAMSAEELQLAVTKRLASVNSEGRSHREAAAFIGDALARSFPCSKASH